MFPLNKAAEDVLKERQRQVEEEGWTAERDGIELDPGELAAAAAAYAIETSALLVGVTPDASRAPPLCWPWRRGWWKPKDARHNLVKAGALILAEIERLDRKTSKGL